MTVDLPALLPAPTIFSSNQDVSIGTRKRRSSGVKIAFVRPLLSLGDGKHHLIFDGDCGICTKSAQICEQMDGGRKFEIVAYQRIPKETLARFGLTPTLCSGEVKVISSTGHVYGGAFAVNYFLLKHQPWTLPIVIIYLIPILLLFEVLVYKLIARNRTRISIWLGLSACKVEQT